MLKSAFLKFRSLNLTAIALILGLAVLIGSLSSFAVSNAAAICIPVVPGQIHRFIAGQDSCLTPMTATEINRKLNDPFATALLRQGIFPQSVSEIADAIDNSELTFQRSSFALGEGSQIEAAVIDRKQPRNLRSVITWEQRRNNPEILLAASLGGNSNVHQIISQDTQTNKFNFYELRRQRQASEETPKVWTWTGGSTLAQNPQTMGKGCFSCHHNGVLIMKELLKPWNNWQSEDATIAGENVAEAVANDPFFRNQVINGGQALERAVKNGARNHYRQWLNSHIQDNGDTIQLNDVNEMLRHLTTNTTLNFESSLTQSDINKTDSANRQEISRIPNNLFLWDSALKQRPLGLSYRMPNLKIQRANYDAYLTQHQFKLVQTESSLPDNSNPLYQVNGSTHFSFFVPVPSFEDEFMSTELRQRNIVSDKFIVALLMVDFKNPVFSQKRSSLQQYADRIPTGTIVNGVSSVPEDFAVQVRTAINEQPACDPNHLDDCTAEAQFLSLWDLPADRWKTIAEQRIQTYLDSITALSPAEQLDWLMQLSIKRRDQFQSWPTLCNLNEFNLLIPQTDLSQVPRPVCH